MITAAADAPLASRAAGAPVPSAAALRDQLRACVARVDRVRARAFDVFATGYPAGEARPASLLEVEGGGVVGSAESVAWTADEQAGFVAAARALLRPGRHAIGELSDRLRAADVDEYTRTAVELAAVDLALRQASTNLFRLTGTAPQPMRFVVSLGVSEDPARSVGEVLARSPGTLFKLDVDPEWPEASLADLEHLADSLVVLDLKLRGGASTAFALHARFPAALLEDPVLTPADAAPGLAARVAYDAPVRRAADVRALPLRPAAVNVKPARMGGLLEALAAIAVCQDLGIATYVGGMFEVGPGRAQSQVLASLFSAAAGNDLAPITPAQPGWDSPSPLWVPDDFVGLGFCA